MDNPYLLELINQGENSAIEFKRGDVRAESLAREIVAFSNSYGGTILLGVDDDRSVLGVDEDKNYEEWVAHIARNNVVPPVNVSCQEIILSSKKIILVDVPKGKERPYQDQTGRFYIRIGSTNRIASLNELMRFFQQSGFYHYDGTEVERSSQSSLNQTALDHYFQSYDVSYLELEPEERISLLKNTDILSENESATIAGLLVFGINPQRFLLNASISFAHYLGNELSEDLIDKKTLKEPYRIKLMQPCR